MSGVPDFAAGLERWSARTALLGEDGTRLSYAELASRADAFGASLPASLALIAIEAAREIEAVVAYIGALRRGVPVIMFDAGAKSDAMLSKFAPNAVWACGDDGVFDLTLASEPFKAEVHPDLALLLSTSGSTGSAKLVRLSGRNLAANAASIVEYLEITPDDVTITSLPLSYSFGLSVLHSYLHAGASVLISDVGLGEPRFTELAKRHGLTSLSGVPTSYELVERSGTLARLPASIRTLTQAGGRMRPDAVRRIHAFAQARGARLFVMYGQTEATARIAYVPPELLAIHPDCVGRAIPGGSLQVVGEGGPLPAGQVGELVYTGPNVMMGYASDRSELALGHGPNTLRTGDLGVEVAPAFFRIEGRLSRFIKPLGLRVSLDELEKVTLSAGVAAVAAGDDQGAVLVVASEKDRQRASAAIDALRLPAEIVQIVVRDLPLLPNGKPDYAAVLADARVPEKAQTTGSKIEELRAAYRPYGGHVRDETRFEDLASDSLSYINASLAVEQVVGRLPADWPQLSLRQLADLAEKQSDAPSRFWARLDSDMFLRAAAISLVVIGHALTGTQGGADALLLLAGFGWARFQRKKLLDGRFFDAFWASLGKLLIIYELIVLAYSIYKREFFERHALFYSTWFADWGGLLNIYWFIQCLFWCSLALVAIHAIAPFRRFSRDRPLLPAICLLGFALLLRFIGAALVDPAANAFRTPDQLFLYFAGGWLMALAGREWRIGTGLLLVAASIHAWGFANPHWPIMAVACFLLTFAPSVWLPRPIAVASQWIGRYGLYIYLVGAVPMWLTDYHLDQRHGSFWWLHITLAIGLGIGVGVIAEQASKLWRRRSSGNADREGAAIPD